MGLFFIKIIWGYAENYDGDGNFPGNTDPSVMANFAGAGVFYIQIWCWSAGSQDGMRTLRCGIVALSFLGMASGILAPYEFQSPQEVIHNDA